MLSHANDFYCPLLIFGCGDCTVCIDKYPKESLKFCQFDNHPESREEVWDVRTCLGDNGYMTCILKFQY